MTTTVIVTDNGYWFKESSTCDALYSMLKETVRAKEIIINEFDCDQADVRVDDMARISAPKEASINSTRYRLNFSEKIMTKLDKLDDVKSDVSTLEDDITDLIENLKRESV